MRERTFAAASLLSVLILVVMEYTQWAAQRTNFVALSSLNPCCNGIYSMSKKKVWMSGKQSLNPCCNGIYSMRQ